MRSRFAVRQAAGSEYGVRGFGVPIPGVHHHHRVAVLR
jgi:hypothetical protein